MNRLDVVLNDVVPPETVQELDNIEARVQTHTAAQYQDALKVIEHFVETNRLIGVGLNIREDNPFVIKFMQARGRLYQTMGQYMDAEKVFLQALSTAETLLHPMHAEARATRALLYRLYQMWHKQTIPGDSLALCIRTQARYWGGQHEANAFIIMADFNEQLDRHCSEWSVSALKTALQALVSLRHTLEPELQGEPSRIAEVIADRISKLPNAIDALDYYEKAIDLLPDNVSPAALEAKIDVLKLRLNAGKENV